MSTDTVELKIKERGEGEVVTEGISYTEGLARMHVYYQKTIGDKTYRLHLAIPKTAGDPRTWYAYEEEHENG